MAMPACDTTCYHAPACMHVHNDFMSQCNVLTDPDLAWDTMNNPVYRASLLLWVESEDVLDWAIGAILNMSNPELFSLTSPCSSFDPEDLRTDSDALPFCNVAEYQYYLDRGYYHHDSMEYADLRDEYEIALEEYNTWVVAHVVILHAHVITHTAVELMDTITLPT